MIKRGEIYYIHRLGPAMGSEQRGAGRPAVIVSNDKNNAYSTTVEVVYLTTANKKDLPTHVTVRGTGRASTALCEQITTVSKEEVEAYAGVCSPQELQALEAAMCVSLGIEQEKVRK